METWYFHWIQLWKSLDERVSTDDRVLPVVHKGHLGDKQLYLKKKCLLLKYFEK